MNPEQFRNTLAQHGIQLSEDQLKQFDEYYRDLVDTNEHVNLTAITEQSAVYLKHFYDSLTGALAYPQLQNQALTICDVGAGAGFPSLPLKIVFPQLKVTIVDSLQKRINFLDELVNQLGLSGVSLVHDRAESFAGKKSSHREAFDVVTARAVARMSVLSEFCLPATKVGGVFLAYKGSAGEEELGKAKSAIRKLGGQVNQVAKLQLPIANEPRQIIVVDKVSKTPLKYPRRPGVPAKKPLS